MKYDDVIIFMGSHRNDGNTAYYVNEMSRNLNEKFVSHKIFNVNDLNVKHCIDCPYCKNNWGSCIHDDDMTEIYDDLKHAKIAIFVSPVYFNGITSKLKTLVDRCQMIFLCDFAHQKPFVLNENKGEKNGYIVSIGGAKYYEDQFRGNELSLKLVFDNLRMTLKQHLKYSNTDRMRLQDSNCVKNDIINLVDEIDREVTNHAGQT